MDDPTRRVKTTVASETRLPGLPVPSGGPNFWGLAFGRFFPDSICGEVGACGSPVVLASNLMRCLTFKPRHLCIERTPSEVRPYKPKSAYCG
jgi:hypothetical protein